MVRIKSKNKQQNIKISNDNIKQANEHRTPKTYLKECIFELDEWKCLKDF